MKLKYLHLISKCVCVCWGECSILARVKSQVHEYKMLQRQHFLYLQCPPFQVFRDHYRDVTPDTSWPGGGVSGVL